MLEYEENYQIKQHGICEEWRKKRNISEWVVVFFMNMWIF